MLEPPRPRPRRVRRSLPRLAAVAVLNVGAFIITIELLWIVTSVAGSGDSDFLVPRLLRSARGVVSWPAEHVPLMDAVTIREVTIADIATLLMVGAATVILLEVIAGWEAERRDDHPYR